MITQGYCSDALKHFDFLNRFNLKKYHNPYQPLVMFGCYNESDYTVARIHNSQLVVVWCGKDILNIKDVDIFKNVINVSYMKPVIDELTRLGLNPIELKDFVIKSDATAIVKGEKVYTYLPAADPAYYGGNLVDKLQTPFNILVGNLSYKKNEWDGKKADEYYNQCFCGLALSEFVGGTGGVIEMGLRGLKVITNTIELPNVIHWNTIEDIEQAILTESEKRGSIDVELAEAVRESVICGELNGFEIDKLIK